MQRSLVAALISTVLIAGCQGLAGEREHSYKWGRPGPRFLHDFIRPDPVAVLGNMSEYTGQDKEVTTAVRRAGERAQSIGALTRIEEDIFLVLSDKDFVGYTVSIRNGDVDVREGLREGVKPTLVVPLTRKQALELPDLLGGRSQDAQGRVVTGITADNLFKLVKLFLVPGLQAVYSIDALYETADRENLGMDDLVQVEVVPPTGNEAAPARVSVINVDGQWLFLDGWHGNPDVRIRLTVPQALEVYQAAVYNFKKAKTATDKALASRKFEELQRSSVVYTRADHK